MAVLKARFPELARTAADHRAFAADFRVEDGGVRFTGVPDDQFHLVWTVDAPCAWAELFADDAKPTRFADVVHNAWRFYDWTDLQKL